MNIRNFESFKNNETIPVFLRIYSLYNSYIEKNIVITPRRFVADNFINEDIYIEIEKSKSIVSESYNESNFNKILTLKDTYYDKDIGNSLLIGDNNLKIVINSRDIFLDLWIKRFKTKTYTELDPFGEEDWDGSN